MSDNYLISISLGSTLDCLVCSQGDLEGQCGENEEGTSQTCPAGNVCGKGTCEIAGTSVVLRTCSDPLGLGNQCIDQVWN